MITAIFLVSLQISPDLPPSEAGTGPDIVVTASLMPIEAEEAPGSVIRFNQETIEALGLTLASDLVRLSPGVSVSTSGARGTETVVRIRGGESNHTLVFIDGIAFNDLAANNAARFDTFTAAGLGRLELIRGPQSALWGSEALGGVIAMSSPDPLGGFRASASLEAGRRDSWLAAAALASGGDRAGLAATAAWSGSDGIDILGGGAGDRDGFENVTLGGRALARFGRFEIGAAGRYIHHEVEFDGTDPVTFRRADTAEASTAETYAVRGWAGFGLDEQGPWSGRIEAQHLDSENRNRDAGVRTNASFGRRLRFGGQAARRLELGRTRHALIAAVEREEEDFGTRDLRFGGASDRDLARSRTALVGEWRASWGDRLVTDVGLRHDDFNHFLDETTVRASVVLDLGSGLSVLAGYGEGIAQPSFLDLFGFGAGSGFIGNPDLRPERSDGFEAGLRWRGARGSFEAIAFSNDLNDEIVEDFSRFPNYTVVNAPGKSRRRGFELAGEWRPQPGLQVGANYSFVDTREAAAGTSALREIRRPRHTANAFAHWRSGRLGIGGSLAYVGRRVDRDFDLFPSPVVTLDDYVLASLNLAFRLLPRLELFARLENGFDADYQDVVGYNTPGRTVHAGLRVAVGR